MTKSHYLRSCATGSQATGNKSARWVVNFNNGNVNNDNDLDWCVRAVRSGEYHDAGSVTLKDLHFAWREARRGKKPSLNQLAFDTRWASGLLDLQHRLNAGTWQPGPSACFIAPRPKAREIHAPAFADRVVHHWLVPKLEAIFEPGFIHDSYANRKGKGSHKAVERLQQFVRQVHSGQGGGWYLQLDVHNFFNSINRHILWNEQIKPRLIQADTSPLVMRVTHSLLRHSPLHAGVMYHCTPTERDLVPIHKRLCNSHPGCGLPIGNLSSQFFANIVLDALDQFVKHELKAKRYLRYVDDFVLVHHDRAQLEIWQAEIEMFLWNKLQLRFKPDIKLRPLADGIDFLGYVVRPTHTLVRRRVVAHAKEKFSAWEQQHVREGMIYATPSDLRVIKSTVASYVGHLKHANSRRLINGLQRRFPWLQTATVRHRFHYQLEGTQMAIKVFS